MIAKNLLTTTIKPLQNSDTIAEALQLMGEHYVKHLPIIQQGVVTAVLSEEDALALKPNSKIQQWTKQLHLPPHTVSENHHIYEVLRLFAEAKLTAVPVVNDEHKYVGIITLEDLLSYLGKSASFKEVGSIIVLEMERRDYSLAELSRIIESENAIILSTFITHLPEPNMIEVTIKIDRENVQFIINGLERHGYTVKAYFTEHQYIDTLKERYDALMLFLNV